MRTTTTIIAALVLSASLAAQEKKKVPSDSVRVSIPGCTKGYIFTVGPRTPDEASAPDLPEGTHLRMNAPKKMMAEIKAHEGSMIQITGLMRKGQFRPGGVSIGGGVSITPGAGPGDGGFRGAPIGNQVLINVESWSPFLGGCPTR